MVEMKREVGNPASESVLGGWLEDAAVTTMADTDEFNSVVPSLCFLPASSDAWLQEEAILISISVTPNLSPMHPDVRDLIRPSRSTQQAQL